MDMKIIKGTTTVDLFGRSFPVKYWQNEGDPTIHVGSADRNKILNAIWTDTVMQQLTYKVNVHKSDTVVIPPL